MADVEFEGDVPEGRTSFASQQGQDEVTQTDAQVREEPPVHVWMQLDEVVRVLRNFGATDAELARRIGAGPDDVLPVLSDEELDEAGLL